MISVTLMFLFAATETVAYSVRIAAVRTQKLAVSLSLFNLIAQFARLAVLIVFPLLGSIVDQAVKGGTVQDLAGSFRLVLLAIAAGSVAGAFFIPFFVGGFSRLINSFVDAGSVPRMVFKLIEHRRLWLRPRRIRPGSGSLWQASFEGLPRGFFLINIAVVAIYTVGSLASIYAGALVPELPITASQLAGVVNGLGAVLLLVFVDPAMAMITDEAMQGRRPLRHVQSAVTFLVGGKVIGTLLAQALFLPAATFIAYAAGLMSHLV
jgi:hypothetical protein